MQSESAVALRAAICSPVRMEAGRPPWARVGCGVAAAAISFSARDLGIELEDVNNDVKIM